MALLLPFLAPRTLVLKVFSLAAMEALVGLAAFGVACNVMQTIHFGLEAASVCKRLWEGKSPAPEVDDHRVALEKAAQELQQSLPSLPANAGDPGDHELRSVVVKLLNVADDLKKELEKCKKSATVSGWRKVKTAFTYIVRRKKEVEKLSRSLKDFQEIMELNILVGLK